nr:butyrate--CoA ligase AAE11, peroxisomal-like [Ipomoea trifida]
MLSTTARMADEGAKMEEMPNESLDAKNIATILRHCEVKVFFVDYDYVEKAGKAVELLMAENTTHYGVVRCD